MIYLVAYLIIGIGAGLIAKRYMPEEIPDGLAIHAAVGAVGGLFGGYLVRTMFLAGHTYDHNYGWNIMSDGLTHPGTWISLITSMVGAVLLLACYKLVRVTRPL